MAAAIDLDDQLLLAAAEVGHVASDWILTDELEAAKSPIPEQLPELPLGIDRGSAKAP